jgi:hypothetical protein
MAGTIIITATTAVMKIDFLPVLFSTSAALSCAGFLFNPTV